MQTGGKHWLHPHSSKPRSRPRPRPRPRPGGLSLSPFGQLGSLAITPTQQMQNQNQITPLVPWPNIKGLSPTTLASTRSHDDEGPCSGRTDLGGRVFSAPPLPPRVSQCGGDRLRATPQPSTQTPSAAALNRAQLSGSRGGSVYHWASAEPPDCCSLKHCLPYVPHSCGAPAGRTHGYSRSIFLHLSWRCGSAARGRGTQCLALEGRGRYVSQADEGLLRRAPQPGSLPPAHSPSSPQPPQKNTSLLTGCFISSHQNFLMLIFLSFIGMMQFSFQHGHL